MVVEAEAIVGLEGRLVVGLDVQHPGGQPPVGQPAEAGRSHGNTEAPPVMIGVDPDGVDLAQGRLPFGGRMALRTVFRNPFRSLVSLLAAAISTALVFTALSMVDALDYLMRYEFQRVERVPMAPHDQRVAAVLTEQGLHRVEETESAG